MLNWKRHLTLFILLIATLFIQYGFLNNLGWGVLCPQLLIFFPIYAGILEGANYGLVCGIIVGLLQDLVIGRFIGANVLVWGSIGFMIGVYSKTFFKENYLIPVVMVAISYAVSSLLYALLIGLLGGNWTSWSRLVQIIASGALVNAIIAPIIYLPIYRSLSYGFLRKKHLEEEVL